MFHVKVAAAVYFVHPRTVSAITGKHHNWQFTDYGAKMVKKSHPSHRRTVAFIAIACLGNQYCKIRGILYKQYKILYINILYNIIIYNNIIYFYSIVSFSTISAPHVRTGLMRRCDGATVRRMRKMFHADLRFNRNRGAIQLQSYRSSMSIADSDVSRACRLILIALDLTGRAGLQQFVNQDVMRKL